MAKKKQGGSFLRGLARGLGADPRMLEGTAEREMYLRDKRQSAANAAADAALQAQQLQMNELDMAKARKALEPQPLPAEIMPQIPGFSGFDGISADPLAGPQTVGAPTLLPDGGMIDGEVLPQIDPIEAASEYVAEMRKAPLDPEGKQLLRRMEKTLQGSRDPNIRPAGQAQLFSQFLQQKEQARLEDRIQEPPTVDSEAETRVKQLSDGTYLAMQDNGRMEIQTDKAELERIKMQGKEKDSQTQMQTMIAQKRAERVQQRQVAEMKQRQADMEAKKKAIEERNARRVEFRKARVAEKPAAEREKEIRDELQEVYDETNAARIKAGGARRQVPDWMVKAELKRREDLDWQESESIYEMDPEVDDEADLTPEDAVVKLAGDDPVAWQDLHDEAQEYLEAKAQREAVEGQDPAEVTEDMIMDEMANRTKQGIQQNVSAWAARKQQGLPTTEPVEEIPTQEQLKEEFLLSGRDPTAADAQAEPLRSLLRNFVPTPEPASPSDVELVKPGAKIIKEGRRYGTKADRERLRKAMAENLQVEPSEIPDKEIDKQYVIPYLIQSSNEASGIAARAKGRKEGRKYLQDQLGGRQDEIAQTHPVIMDDEDFDNLQPNQSGINAETGELVERPLFSEEAEQFRMWKRVWDVDTPMVSDQETYDDVEEGRSYFDEHAGRMRIKKDKKYVHPDDVVATSTMGRLKQKVDDSPIGSVMRTIDSFIP